MDRKQPIHRFNTQTMYRLYFTLILLGVGFSLQAKPSWITRLPESNSSFFYYRVTFAQDKSYDKAYSKAFAKAILESQWKLGVKVQEADINTLEEDITKSLNVSSKNVGSLALNKVCEWIEPINIKQEVRVYILWQVAKYATVDPNFEEFTNCE